MMPHLRGAPQLATTLLCCVLGCSRGGPPTHRVAGTVTYQGQPVAEAQVGFVPDGDGGDIKPARGQTDAQGRYTLRTYVKPGLDVPGAMAGSYKVTVEKGLPQKQIVEYEDLIRREHVLPPHYADARRTTLSAQVVPGGENRFDFPLEDAP